MKKIQLLSREKELLFELLAELPTFFTSTILLEKMTVSKNDYTDLGIWQTIS